MHVPTAKARGRICVLESRSLPRRLLAELLSGWGYEVDEREGITRLARESSLSWQALIVGAAFDQREIAMLAWILRGRERHRSERCMLIALFEPGRRSDGPIGQGIDHWLPEPVPAGQLRALLAGGRAQEPSRSQGSIDAAALARFGLSNAARRAELFSSLRDNLRRDLASLETALAHGDSLLARRALHRLRGGGPQFLGLGALIERCGELEGALSAGDDTRSQRGLQRLAEEVESVCSLLDGLDAEHGH